MSSDFLSLLERLINSGVEFVVVGGFAGVVHGCTYVTQDIDICCDFAPSNLYALQKALSDLHPVHRMTPKRKKLRLTEKTINKFKNLYLDTKLGQLDCLSFIEGIGDYEQVKKTSSFIRIEGIKIRVLSIEALIKAKNTMNRPRDRDAIIQLKSIKKLRKKKPTPGK